MRTDRNEGGAATITGKGAGAGGAGAETIRRLVDMIRVVEARTSDRGGVPLPGAPSVGECDAPIATLALHWPALDSHACGFASSSSSDPAGDDDATAFTWSCSDPTPPPFPLRDPPISNQKSAIRNPPLRLALAAVHEWIGVFEPDGTIAPREPWTPPILLLTHLLWCALEQAASAGGTSGGDPRRIIWIGKRIWPHGIALLREEPFHPFDFDQRNKAQRLPSLGPSGNHTLPSPTGESGESAHATVGGVAEGTAGTGDIRFGDGSGRSSGEPGEPGEPGDHSGGFSQLTGDALLRRSIFVDPPDDASRLWAIDLALRSPAVLAVVADGSRLDMSASRRLQLAAESAALGGAPQRASGSAGRGALALIARPPDDRRRLSAAATRWLVRRRPSPTGPAWSIHLLRAKASHAPLIPALRRKSKPRPFAIRRTG